MGRFHSLLRHNLLPLYSLSVVAAFLACFFFNASLVHNWQWTDVIVFALAIAVFESNVVEVSNEPVSITMTSALLFAESTNIGLFPALYSILLSSPIVLIRYRKPLYNKVLVLFNLSHIGVATTVAVWTWHRLGGELGTYNNVLALAAYLFVYFVTNSTFVILVTKLQVESGWRETVGKVFELQTLILYLIDINLGVLMGLAFQAYQVWAVPTIAVVLLLIAISYRKFFRIINDARKDELTGLLNRKELKQQLHSFIKRNRPFSVMMLDLDHFKQVNDTLGHLQGDQVLRVVANLISTETDRAGIVARYGGEEFCVIVPSVLDGVWNTADHVRRQVEQHDFDELQIAAHARLTVSIGIASFPAHGTTAQLLMERADRALYAAKAVRNCVVMYDESTDAMRHNLVDDGSEASIVPTGSE